jgi:hypothetical protein
MFHHSNNLPHGRRIVENGKTPVAHEIIEYKTKVKEKNWIVFKIVAFKHVQILATVGFDFF